MNKVDLVSGTGGGQKKDEEWRLAQAERKEQRLSQAEAYVREVVSAGAGNTALRVLRCINSDVALPSILDVVVPCDQHEHDGAIGHEGMIQEPQFLTGN